MKHKENRILIGNRVAIYPRGKKQLYVADFWHDGKHRRQSLKTGNLKVARARAIALEAELETGQYAKAYRKVEITTAISDYIAHLTTENRRPKTIQKYKAFLSVFAEYAAKQNARHLHVITATLVDQFRALRKPTHAPKSMLNEGVQLKGFLCWCENRNLIAQNPIAKMKFARPVAVPRGGPSIEQIQQVLLLAEEPRRTQIATIAFTGCRSGELRQLRPEDVDLENGWIHIVSRSDATTKTGHSRKVPIHACLHVLLSRMPKTKRLAFFTSEPRRGVHKNVLFLNPKRLNEDFLALLKRAGIPAGRNGGFTIHSLRHFFETHCVNAGIPQRVVDTWLGHRSDRSMASIYYRLSDEDSQKFMKQLLFEPKTMENQE